MEQVKRLFRKDPKLGCTYCRELYDGGVRIPAAEVFHGVLAGCPACHLLYECAEPSDLGDSRISLVDARFFGDSIIQYTFDPMSEEMSRHLCAEEGNLSPRS